MINTIFFKRYSVPVVFLLAFMVYGISAGIKIDKQSNTPQYVHLANSFLHGHVDLVTLPERKFDLINYQDKWYVPGGMMPALLLIPVVAVFGTNASDVFFGVTIGAFNVALMYSLLSSLSNDRKTQIWLTILFAFGTVHWWISSVGSVWFNAHLVALTFMILFVEATLRDKPWLAGLFLGFAALSRPPTMFSALFFVFVVFSRQKDLLSTFKKSLAFGVTLAISLAVMMAYNYARFGSILEFGYGHVWGTRALTNAFSTDGGFNIKYIPCNMYVSVLGMPNIQWNPLPDVNAVCSHLNPIVREFKGVSHFFNPIGMSVFLTTPAFLLIFRAKLRDELVVPAWLGMMGTLAVLWMYHTTGWVQFGYRYILDVAVFIFILLARSTKQVRLLEKILIGLSIIMGGAGLFLMYYMNFGLKWHKMIVELMKKFYWFIF